MKLFKKIGITPLPQLFRMLKSVVSDLFAQMWYFDAYWKLCKSLWSILRATHQNLLSKNLPFSGNTQKK